MAFLGGFLDDISGFARKAAPLITAGAALSTGGQAASLMRAASAASALGGLRPGSYLQEQPIRQSETGQSVAVSITETAPRETAMSGEFRPMNAAFRGPIPTGAVGRGIEQASLPAIISGGRSAVSTIGGMLGLAGGAIAVAPIILDPITGEEKKLRVTRRLKSNVKKAVEMFGVEFVAEQMGTSIDVIFYILTKRMRNDGPAITKAALRKTRSTMRKLDAMCDMRDKMRPPARRATTRRATTSKVMQIKN
jgi:hypothetical protein